ncbi:DUF4190 domain-containing protein [Actinoplanes palleronii]|uniref:Regulator of septum formation n=1 Tax=Actinoplanes palleronii TaxID=113570 RepID=A0ABQ4BEX1_9ACTN|nr:DUF4190 domain-containing protein [Actinoplanes palleronii]GIE69230.1 hypothetical protein Apa02nite_053380 [Actinoplanes palleronii]
MNEEIPGQPNQAPGLSPIPQQPDPLAGYQPGSDPTAAFGAPPTTPMYNAAPSYAAPSYETPAPPPPYGGYPQQPYPGQAYPQPGYPGQPYPMYGQQPDSGRTNGFAIASLIFGILGGLLGIVFGLIALGQIPKRGDRGKGLAIAGLSLSIAWIVLIVGIVAVGNAVDNGKDTSTTTATRPTAVTTEPADVRTDKLAAGDCIATLTDSETVYDLPVVACTQSHEGEVYTVFTLASGVFPGEAKVEAEAEKRCDKEIEPYAIGTFTDAEIYYVYPSSQSWKVDRTVTCIAVAPDSGKWTGSMIK